MEITGLAQEFKQAEELVLPVYTRKSLYELGILLTKVLFFDSVTFIPFHVNLSTAEEGVIGNLSYIDLIQLLNSSMDVKLC